MATMNVKIQRRDLRENLEKALVEAKKRREPEWFWFVGDNSTTDFDLPAGWKPKAAYVGGSLKRGVNTTPDYTVEGPVTGVYTVSFTVAPGTSADVGVEAWPEL